ncbi:MAG: hypothetical protein U1A78_33655 [Polyangia bacterium]
MATRAVAKNCEADERAAGFTVRRNQRPWGLDGRAASWQVQAEALQLVRRWAEDSLPAALRPAMQAHSAAAFKEAVDAALLDAVLRGFVSSFDTTVPFRHLFDSLSPPQLSPELAGVLPKRERARLLELAPRVELLIAADLEMPADPFAVIEDLRAPMELRERLLANMHAAAVVLLLDCVSQAQIQFDEPPAQGALELLSDSLERDLRYAVALKPSLGKAAGALGIQPLDLDGLALRHREYLEGLAMWIDDARRVVSAERSAETPLRSGEDVNGEE